jgi:thiol-disulfide isomerase/thioredoxin
MDAIGRQWLVVLVAGGLALAGPGRAAAAERPPLAEGTKAPNFFVKTYNPQACGAKRVFLDKLVGERAGAGRKKLVILSFFNIDCKPCRKELPFLQRLHERYRDEGLAVVVVNCDYKQDKIAQVEKYVTEAGFTFPVLKDRFQALQRRYSIGKFPTMYILDPAGLIVDVRVGYNEKKKPFPLADLQRRLGVAQQSLPPAGKAAGAAERNEKQRGAAKGASSKRKPGGKRGG